jgi:hypothetical protein
LENAQAGKQWKYGIWRKKFVKGAPKTLFIVWATQQLDSKARHGKSRLETSDRQGLANFGLLRQSLAVVYHN